MAEILNYNNNDTLITLALNGDENNLLSFDPGDLNFRKGFYEIQKSIKIKEKEIDIKLKKINPDDIKSQFDLEEELFNYMSNMIDKIFGQNSTKKICGNRRNPIIIANFLIAIAPYVKKFNEDAKNKYVNNLKNAGVI